MLTNPTTDYARAARDIYAAQNGPVLFTLIASIKRQLDAALDACGAMTSDADFAIQQSAIAAILTAGATAINAAAPVT